MKECSINEEFWLERAEELKKKKEVNTKKAHIYNCAMRYKEEANTLSLCETWSASVNGETGEIIYVCKKRLIKNQPLFFFKRLI
ncbi:hypothetical protein CVV26_01790 [Candidatus Kuenenbacteria bacterium HGW-Kuenenbacteria-1]|uniref:Uncharacterized protein n=1 Tax=Candidatus Kuenenbacteria bacterium HGW-Kuenenbacteria-1 TaxID=2013812 RepID=A0A2N1UNH8_9BACT|nr:MAG: hypothetical protein CVV26_01790 [Candidatus Kuenenbacteria bacterium HGW-Kuenenbacteria-1]